jgi:uncharacterized protein YndB with AHSA1/START domain
MATTEFGHAVRRRRDRVTPEDVLTVAGADLSIMIYTAERGTEDAERLTLSRSSAPRRSSDEEAAAMTIDIAREADDACPADRVFDLITDLGGQDRWLTQSSSFKGTTDFSTERAQLGTTYSEPGPLGVRNGVVTEFEPPTRITFHQPMTVKFGAGVLDVTVRYVLTPTGAGTHVHRVATLGVPRHLVFLRPVVVRATRIESSRTLAALTGYADANG